MTAPQDAIRARRKLTNRLIAAHDARRLAPFFDPQATLISGEGGDELLFVVDPSHEMALAHHLAPGVHRDRAGIDDDSDDEPERPA